MSVLAPGIQLLYESGPCIVVFKPAGLATQAPAGIDSLEARIKDWLRARRDREPTEHALDGRDVYLGVPHRLDRPVSGAMLFATRRKTARKLSEQFERREVRKTYWACVQGVVDPPAGTWTDQLKKIFGHPRAEVVEAGDPQGRLAVMHYRTRQVLPWGVWLEIALETGRTHQIRVQASSRGHAVLGDAFYGGTLPFGEPTDDERLRTIALHGQSLSFFDPVKKEPVSVAARPPASWDSLGLDLPG